MIKYPRDLWEEGDPPYECSAENISSQRRGDAEKTKGKESGMRSIKQHAPYASSISASLRLCGEFLIQLNGEDDGKSEHQNS
ncbi:MAG TPA: hypothetical protein VGC91_14790 [Pyrinomonadaceae bacterium]|jgi:hypothetical protein